MPPSVRLRRARPTDARTLYHWKNLPENVAVSASQTPVTLAEHLAWFEAVLKDPGRRLWIIEPDAGMVRVDRFGLTATVSIYLKNRYRGRGIGREALRSACKQAFADWTIQEIRAEIRMNNPASLATFKAAGFTVKGSDGDRHTVMLSQPDRGQPGETDAAVHPLSGGAL